MHYTDPESPFVIFDVPFEHVSALLGDGGLIQVSTAPPGVTHGRVSEARRLLFSAYQTSQRELVRRYSGSGIQNK